jgi:hypothetical protein
MRPEGLGNLIKIFHLIGSRTRDLIIIIIMDVWNSKCFCSRIGFRSSGNSDRQVLTSFMAEAAVLGREIRKML